MQKLAVATVLKVKEVTIDGSRTNMGQYSGGVLGAAAAMPRGGIGGTGQALAVAGASVVGAIAGQSIEEFVTRKKAQEVTVQMSNGDVFVIVQATPPLLQPGDKVNVIHGPNGARLEMALDF
jgi:outer membrane lipoprotein SlyB